MLLKFLHTTSGNEKWVVAKRSSLSWSSHFWGVSGRIDLAPNDGEVGLTTCPLAIRRALEKFPENQAGEQQSVRTNPSDWLMAANGFSHQEPVNARHDSLQHSDSISMHVLTQRGLLSTHLSGVLPFTLSYFTRPLSFALPWLIRWVFEVAYEVGEWIS